MHPAPSIIVFTTLSGLGLGLLAYLGLGLITPTGLAAFLWFTLGYGLTLGGLAASAFHLGHPERALKAFTQWRTSWLSREAVLATAALLFLAPHAIGLIFFNTDLRGFGVIGGVLALQTVFSTAMIYGQLKSVPRWNHWSTPAVFLIAALTGGSILAGLPFLAQMLLAWLGVTMVLHWIFGDNRFAASGTTLGTATGLGERGAVRQLEPPHTGSNYLLKEMAFVVARRHVVPLRLIALLAASILPAVLLALAPLAPAALIAAALIHLVGMLAARWLFFAQAEHVVGLYYGIR